MRVTVLGDKTPDAVLLFPAAITGKLPEVLAEFYAVVAQLV
jgi:hypothetical protein